MRYCCFRYIKNIMPVNKHGAGDKFFRTGNLIGGEPPHVRREIKIDAMRNQMQQRHKHQHSFF